MIKIKIGKFKVRSDLLYAYLHSIEDIGFNVEKSRTTYTLDEVREKHHWNLVHSLGILGKQNEVENIVEDIRKNRCRSFHGSKLHHKWLQNKKEVREFAQALADWIEKQMKKNEATGGSVWARFRK